MLGSIVLLISTVGPALSVNANQPKRPNVLLILVDDLGMHDLSIEGSTFYRSPNIDQFARSGMRFTAGYANCRVCSPSRASIMLGQFTARHGVTNWIGATSGMDYNRNEPLLTAEYREQLPAEDTTLAEAMKEAGYKTFFAGKWHLGGEGTMPTDHGFDINKGGNDHGHPSHFFSPYGNPQLPDGPDGESLTARLAKETSEFIRDQKDQPYFAMLSFYTVHSPVQTTRSLWEKYRAAAPPAPENGQRFKVDRTMPVRQVQDHPVYAGMIEALDNAVGEVLATIEDKGERDSTLVIFTSDNGGVSSGDAYSTSNLPLRGGKGRQWEGGIREPFYIRYPKITEPGTQSAAPAIGSDLYPTILDLCGIESKPNQHVDGVALTSALKGQPNDQLTRRPLYWHYPHYDNQGGEPSSLMRLGEYKLIQYHLDQQNELYHLPSDPSEQNDISAEQPDRTRKMAEQLLTWLESVDAKMATPDPRYDAAKAAAKWQRIQGPGKKRLEDEHAAYLNPDWKPDADWWGSALKVQQQNFDDLKQQLNLTWPKNRLLRFVFHGHSVPAGYFRAANVRRFDSYPILFHQALCQQYPTAVIDVCTTAIGGENSRPGSKRFAEDVLTMKPDVIFIDYCLNDRGIGVDAAKRCWRTMIEQALENDVKVVLLTPTPDSHEDILDPETKLAKHAESIRELGKDFGLPVVDSYAAFQERVSGGADVNTFLSQPNHPNRKGHEVVAELIMSLF